MTDKQYAYYFDDYADLTPDILTNLYLYGAPKKTHYSPLRPKDTTIKIGVDMKRYMTEGPGRYAHASSAKFVQNFFNGKVSLQDGFYTKEDLTKKYKISEDDFNISLDHATLDPKSSDYNERTYMYAKSGYTISQNAKFVVKGEDRYVSDMAVHARWDDFDFKSGKRWHQAGNYLAKPFFDITNIGREVDIAFDNKEAVPVKEKYTRDDFLNDAKKFDAIPKATAYDAADAMLKTWISLPWMAAHREVNKQLVGFITEKSIHNLIGSDAYWKQGHTDHQKIHDIVGQWYKRAYSFSAPIPPRKPVIPQTPLNGKGPVHVRAHTREGGKEKVKMHNRSRPNGK